jgi:hypothetical protein
MNSSHLCAHQRTISYIPGLRRVGISTTVRGTLLGSLLIQLHQEGGLREFHLTDATLARLLGMSISEVRGARADLLKDRGTKPYFTYEVRGRERMAFWNVDHTRISLRLIEAAMEVA